MKAIVISTGLIVLFVYLITQKSIEISVNGKSCIQLSLDKEDIWLSSFDKEFKYEYIMLSDCYHYDNCEMKHKIETSDYSKKHKIKFIQPMNAEICIYTQEPKPIKISVHYKFLPSETHIFFVIWVWICVIAVNKYLELSKELGRYI